MMKTTKLALAGAAIAVLCAGAALAQPYGGGGYGGNNNGGYGGNNNGGYNGGGYNGGGYNGGYDNDNDDDARVVLYEYPNYQGRSVTVTTDTPDLNRLGFNDVPMSARIEGDWRLCEHVGYQGRCVDLDGNVPDLSRYNLSRQLSSLRSDDNNDGWNGGGNGGWNGGGGPNGGWNNSDGRSEGRTAVFFPRPTINGNDVVAFNRQAADTYCQRQGYAAAIYYDTTSRGQRALGFDNRFQVNVPVLRDVLCRRR
ncbi:MAG: beta/gamma crystallin-related protein [Caulobacteraceae bacterium]